MPLRWFSIVLSFFLHFVCILFHFLRIPGSTWYTKAQKSITRLRRGAAEYKSGDGVFLLSYSFTQLNFLMFLGGKNYILLSFLYSALLCFCNGSHTQGIRGGYEWEFQIKKKLHKGQLGTKLLTEKHAIFNFFFFSISNVLFFFSSSNIYLPLLLKQAT